MPTGAPIQDLLTHQPPVCPTTNAHIMKSKQSQERCRFNPAEHVTCKLGEAGEGRERGRGRRLINEGMEEGNGESGDKGKADDENEFRGSKEMNG